MERCVSLIPINTSFEGIKDVQRRTGLLMDLPENFTEADLMVKLPFDTFKRGACVRPVSTGMGKDRRCTRSLGLPGGSVYWGG